jgi:hypothetical protein
MSDHMTHLFVATQQREHRSIALTQLGNTWMHRSHELTHIRPGHLYISAFHFSPVQSPTLTRTTRDRVAANSSIVSRSTDTSEELLVVAVRVKPCAAAQTLFSGVHNGIFPMGLLSAHKSNSPIIKISSLVAPRSQTPDK